MHAASFDYSKSNIFFCYMMTSLNITKQEIWYSPICIMKLCARFLKLNWTSLHVICPFQKVFFKVQTKNEKTNRYPWSCKMLHDSLSVYNIHLAIIHFYMIMAYTYIYLKIDCEKSQMKRGISYKDISFRNNGLVDGFFLKFKVDL